MIKNKTPICDRIMKKIGWTQYDDVPMFYKRVPNTYNTKAKYCYFISFPTEHYGMYGIYEEWLNDGKLPILKLKQHLKENFSTNNANTYAKNKKELERCLPMLAADFYWHNGDKENHKKYVDIYEKITNKKY